MAKIGLSLVPSTASRAAACLMLGALMAAPPVAGADGDDDFLRLTILHNNDIESALVPTEIDGKSFGGAGLFTTYVRFEKLIARILTDGSLLLSSGDNFIPSPALDASIDQGQIPLFDSIFLDAVGYDALALGNHEFDLGTDVLADFIGNGFGTANPAPPFLSANLDFQNVPPLQALANAGRIAASTVVTVKGQKVGIVGATTETIATISSPGDTIINAVQPAVQAEIDALEASGVKIIVLISHLQDVNSDLALLAQLDGVDVAIAGGGDELLANPGDRLFPGDVPAFPYPILGTRADGTQVPVVTTSGNLRYLGRLVVWFDDGELVFVSPRSGPVLIRERRFLKADPTVVANVEEPVAAFIATLGEIIGTTEVALDGRRADDGRFGGSPIRSQETALGSLLADALKADAEAALGESGFVALQNGGGIRNNDNPATAIIGPGTITAADTGAIAPFGNAVVVVTLTHQQLVDLVEYGIDEGRGGGRYPHVAGMRVEYDDALASNGADDPLVIRDLTLDDGTQVVVGGSLPTPGATVKMATINFLADERTDSGLGGDGYPFPNMTAGDMVDDACGTPTRPDCVVVGTDYKVALENFIRAQPNANVSLVDYPEVPRPQPLGTGDRMVPVP